MNPTNLDMTKYENASKIVYLILYKHLEKFGKKPFFDDDMKKLYRLLTYYFTQNKEFENASFKAKIEDGFYEQKYSLKKGLLLMGYPGRGKTYAMEYIFSPFANRFFPDLRYVKYNAFNIVQACEEEGSKALFRYQQSFYRDYKPRHIYIDEIGAEAPQVQHYGNKIQPILSILHTRHKQFIENGAITHATTNLDLNGLEQHYDFRIKSRIFELFNIIQIGKGQDLRML